MAGARQTRPGGPYISSPRTQPSRPPPPLAAARKLTGALKPGSRCGRTMRARLLEEVNGCVVPFVTARAPLFDRRESGTTIAALGLEVENGVRVPVYRKDRFQPVARPT